ncbi:ABC transporter ATP-binding protein/permease [Paralimibaculum aggregatum]|uniref:ABC transporter ATP-binding protein/permease n=1 Tax=Paralimibaculum aggregatum TaxID=3036245 RepID=A0ABQ6LG14_9RHOB|nr:ABC transporter ATP-binding protein/permease [Limibaculum sp. NKW23]GMG82262.1 ABC transporter ATP-binding protein/permease [Limibaculum sp. NKW23]
MSPRSRRRTPGAGGGEAPPDLRILARALPDLWPEGRRDLRLRVVVAVLLLVAAKAATILMPFVYKAAVDALAPGQGQAVAAPILLVAAYGVARLAGTVLQQLRDAVFARVSQHALRRLALRTFGHIHRLSLGYHLSRRTGALSRIVDRGVKAIDFLLRFVLFSIVPLMVELLIVVAIFWLHFGAAYAAVLAATVVVYTIFTFRTTEWRVKIRMEMNREDQDAHQKAVDSLLNYETVKYFDASTREAERYDRALKGYQEAAIKTTTSLALLNSGQAVIIALGMVAVMGMTAQAVAAGTMTVGDFVMVNAFMIQITVPLNFLGTVYREIRQSLVDMREMFELTDTAPEVQDAPGAPAFRPGEGRVTFRGVRFGYGPDREVLRGLDFDVPGGGKLAIVGPSGAGKSTVARLLFRFYDVTGGAVEIDGQDVRGVTQESLRRGLGVVPQDTVLFNDTIGYNIAYGRAGASREEVEAAARAARIDGFIEGLPQGYDTLVGERGLKLSGGEKQRVAIARTILKNPPVLVLDEATSALDTGTERAIQAELRRLGEGRTVIMIAHRLSTVVEADEIVVLEAGRVVERGTHGDLLARGGVYARMWAAQEADAGQPEAGAAAE